MAPYRWVHGRPLRRSCDHLPTVSPGDTFEPTDSELRHFGDRIESVDEGTAAEDEDEDDADREETFDIDSFIDLNADEQASIIESGDVDAHLDEISEANEQTNEYSTVRKAIEERQEELDD